MDEDELFDLRDAMYDSTSVDDLREKVAVVVAFWSKRGGGTAAAGVARFLDRFVFDESPAEAIIIGLQAMLARIADSDPKARRILDVLFESRPVSS